MRDELPVIPYSEVRAHLAETLRDLESRGEAVVISRRGEPTAVLMSLARYRRLTGTDAGFGEALQAWRDRHVRGLRADAAGRVYQDPFADVRDRRAQGGRAPFDWNEEPSTGPVRKRKSRGSTGRADR